MSLNKDNLLNPISTQELERRWGLARTAMRERGIDALVVQCSNEHMGGYVRWFTDFPATNGYPRSVLFPGDDLMTVVEQGPMGEEHLVGADDYVHRGVKRRIFNPSYCTVHYTKHFNAEQMSAAIRSAGYGTIGLVGTASMYYDFCEHLKSSLSPAVRFVDATEEIDLFKAQKSDEEIERVRRTAKMQDEVMAAVAHAIKPGMKDYEITALAQYRSQLLESEQGTYNGASMPLGKPSFWHFHRHEQGREMREGDHLTLLIENNGAGGFYTELQRIFVLGKAPQDLSDGFEFMKEAQQHTLRYLRPGISFKEVFAEHDAFMKRRGLPPEKRMYAHGQGYDLVERPLIRDDETMAVAQNMNIAVHPSFSSGRMFAAVCDNFVVTEGDPERLHQTPQRIFEI